MHHGLFYLVLDQTTRLWLQCKNCPSPLLKYLSKYFFGLQNHDKYKPLLSKSLVEISFEVPAELNLVSAVSLLSIQKACLDQLRYICFRYLKEFRNTAPSQLVFGSNRIRSVGES